MKYFCVLVSLAFLLCFVFGFPVSFLGSDGDPLVVEPEFTLDCSIWVREFIYSVMCRNPLSFHETCVKPMETASLGL